jgi:hypothetical protein
MLISSPALGCTITPKRHAPPHYTSYDAAVIVRTKTVRRDGAQWIAEGEVTGVLKGQPDKHAYEFAILSKCNSTVPAPNVGDLWMIYLQDYEGKQVFANAMPLDSLPETVWQSFQFSSVMLSFAAIPIRSVLLPEFFGPGSN